MLVLTLTRVQEAHDLISEFNGVSAVGWLSHVFGASLATLDKTDETGMPTLASFQRGRINWDDIVSIRLNNYN